jgi:hypothetical protein
VLLRIFNLVFRALVCGLLFSDAFANGLPYGGLPYVERFIFGRLSTVGWLLQWSLGQWIQWIGRISMVWSQCGRAARPWIFQRFEKVFFLNHTFYKYIFFLSFLILIILYCAIVYKGGLALNSILLNKHTRYGKFMFGGHLDFVRHFVFLLQLIFFCTYLFYKSFYIMIWTLNWD